MEENQKNASLQIKDLETLKVIADTLRMQILEVLTKSTLTVKQIGDRFGLAPSKLYYHINLLEKHDLIQVVETRMVSNMVEKYYRANFSQLEIDHALLTFKDREGQENINTLVNTTLNTTRDDILRSLQARAFELEHGVDGVPPRKQRRVIITRLLSRLPEERFEEFQSRLEQILKEFDEADSDSEQQAFALTVALFPTYYFPEVDGAGRGPQTADR